MFGDIGDGGVYSIRDVTDKDSHYDLCFCDSFLDALYELSCAIVLSQNTSISPYLDSDDMCEILEIVEIKTGWLKKPEQLYTVERRAKFNITKNEYVWGTL